MPCQHTRRHGKHKALLKTYQWQTRGCPFNLSKCLFCNAECLEPNCQENSACTRAGKQHYLPIVWFPGIWKLDCGLWSSLRVKGGGGGERTQYLDQEHHEWENETNMGWRSRTQVLTLPIHQMAVSSLSCPCPAFSVACRAQGSSGPLPPSYEAWRLTAWEGRENLFGGEWD